MSVLRFKKSKPKNKENNSLRYKLNNNKKKQSNTRFFYWLLVAILVVLIFFSFTGTSSYGEKVLYNQAIEHFEKKEVESWYVVGNSKIIFKLTDGADSKVGEKEFPRKADFYITYNSQEYKTLLEHEEYGELYYGSEPPAGSLFDYIYPVLMIGLGIAIIYFMYKMFSGKGNAAMGFGKSKARAIGGIKVRFADIAGAEEEKEELAEVVEFLTPTVLPLYSPDLNSFLIPNTGAPLCICLLSVMGLLPSPIEGDFI